MACLCCVKEVEGHPDRQYTIIFTVYPGHPCYFTHIRGKRGVRILPVETDWCKKGHIVYILEGTLEVNFDGNVVVFNTGDGLFIPAGEKDKHMGKALTKVVKMIFVEDVL